MSDRQQEGPDLSVVIIAKNEEEMIGRCIESALSAIEYAKKKGVIQTAEVILSDSASTDKTIEIAVRFPIKIIQLKSSWKLSAAAGLYIGFLFARGRYVQNLGGDQIIDKKWFSNAIPYYKEEKLAAVSGFEAEYLSERLQHAKEKVEQAQNVPPGETDMVGNAIFKSIILKKKVGLYNPYLKGGEDRELSYRIINAGYKLLKIPYLSTTHYWAGETGELDLITYLKSAYNWSKGDGQAFRASMNNKEIAMKHLKRYANAFYIRIYKDIFLYYSLVYINILSVLLIPQTLTPLYFTMFIDFVLISLSIAYMVIAYKRGKWNEFLFSLRVYPYTFVRHIGFILGFLKNPKDPSTYPTDVKIIKNLSLEKKALAKKE